MTEIHLPPEKKLEEIRINYENLIQKIVLELESNKEEQQKLKEEIQNVIEDNSRLSADAKSKLDLEVNSEHEQLTSDAITNLKLQVRHLEDERSTVKQLWKSSQETIANLESEIRNYRNELFKPSAFTEIKEKYCKAVKALEDIITNQKNQICKQACIIRDLTNDKDSATERIKKLQSIVLEKDSKLSEALQLEKINQSLKQQLENAMKTNAELEVSTSLAKVMIDERFVREKNALEKLQEALLIAETAMAEKEEALKREIVIKEECESLATTIGQVMDEAARKVEENIDGLKKEFQEKEEQLSERHKKMLDELEKQVNITCLMEGRCRLLEEKLKEALENNAKLEGDLQTASEAMAKMELKLEATEKLIKEDKKQEKISEEREKQLKRYIESNKQLKQRWKSTIEDLTNRFGTEIERLQKENAYLRTEIESQRFKLNRS